MQSLARLVLTRSVPVRSGIGLHVKLVIPIPPVALRRIELPVRESRRRVQLPNVIRDNRNQRCIARSGIDVEILPHSVVWLSNIATRLLRHQLDFFVVREQARADNQEVLVCRAAMLLAFRSPSPLRPSPDGRGVGVRATPAPSAGAPSLPAPHRRDIHSPAIDRANIDRTPPDQSDHAPTG